MDLWFLGQPIGWVSVWPCSEHPYRLLCFGSMSLSSFGVGMSGMSLLHLFSGKIKSLQLWFEMVWTCFNQTWTTKGQPCGRILRKGFDTPRERSFVSSDLAASVAFSRRASPPHEVEKLSLPSHQENHGKSELAPHMFNHVYISGINFRCKSLGRVISKVENLVFYKHENETGVLFAEGFAEKILFLSSTKLSEVQENVQQRSMTYVWKCKRTYYVAAVALNVNIAPPPPPPPLPPAPTPKISTRARPLTGVDTTNMGITE